MDWSRITNHNMALFVNKGEIVVGGVKPKSLHNLCQRSGSDHQCSENICSRGRGIIRVNSGSNHVRKESHREPNIATLSYVLVVQGGTFCRECR